MRLNSTCELQKKPLNQTQFNIPKNTLFNLPIYPPRVPLSPDSNHRAGDNGGRRRADLPEIHPVETQGVGGVQSPGNLLGAGEVYGCVTGGIVSYYSD